MDVSEIFTEISLPFTLRRREVGIASCEEEIKNKGHINSPFIESALYDNELTKLISSHFHEVKIPKLERNA